MLQRDVLFTRLEITQHEMSLAEGAAGAVLPAQPDGRALANKTAESQRLRVGPVDLGVAVKQLAPLCDEGLELGMKPETVGERGEPVLVGAEVGQRAELVFGDGEGNVGLEGLLFPARLFIGRFKPAVVRLADAVQFLLPEAAFLNQAFGVERKDRRMLVNLFVEQRLGVAGLVTLIVTVAPVAEDVDDHILPETLAVGEGYLCDPCRGFRIVAVDVENRGLDRLRHIRRVGRRTGFLGRGREPDLIVDDDVNRPPGAVAAEL